MEKIDYEIDDFISYCDYKNLSNLNKEQKMYTEKLHKTKNIKSK